MIMAQLQLFVCLCVRHTDLRIVKPYNYEFTTYAKKRWIGRTILEVCSSEFRLYSSNYYVIITRQHWTRVITAYHQPHAITAHHHHLELLRKSQRY